MKRKIISPSAIRSSLRSSHYVENQSYCCRLISASITGDGRKNYLQCKRYSNKSRGLKAKACHYCPEIPGFFLLVNTTSLQADDSYLIGFHNSHKNCGLCLAHFFTAQIFVNLTSIEFLSMEAQCRHRKDLKKTKKIGCFSMIYPKLVIQIQQLFTWFLSRRKQL